MNEPLHHDCAARLQHISDLHAFVERFSQAAGLGDAVSLRLTLAIEELFTNTVHHGHGGDCDATVRVSLHLDGDAVVLHYVDQAPPFDPLARVHELRAERDAPSDERPVGRLGLLLVLEMALEARHQHLEGCNHLRLRFSASP